LTTSWQDGQTYEMMFEMMRTTMGIIADIIFSVKDIQREAADLNQALTTVFEVLTTRTTAFQQLPLWAPTSDNRRVQRAARTIESFIMNLIRQRRSEGKDYGDVLSDLINAQDAETGATLNDQEICNELKTLFGAGHETTALMLMWTLYLLAQNPSIEEKLNLESLDVLDGRQPTLEDLKRMPYTEMVINESMRLYPPAWSLMVRRAHADMQFGDTLVPAGSVMLIPMWVIQRSADVFERPLEFDPERFAGDWKARNSKYAYFPFGGGPHVCLGASLAMFEGQVILPMLASRFHFELVPQDDLKLRALLTLRPAKGLYLKVIRRAA
jgi:cytochrome P450